MLKYDCWIALELCMLSIVTLWLWGLPNFSDSEVIQSRWHDIPYTSKVKVKIVVFPFLGEKRENKLQNFEAWIWEVASHNIERLYTWENIFCNHCTGLALAKQTTGKMQTHFYIQIFKHKFQELMNLHHQSKKRQIIGLNMPICQVVTSEIHNLNRQQRKR